MKKKGKIVIVETPNLAAQALRCKIFKGKVIPNKKKESKNNLDRDVSKHYVTE